MRMKQLKTLFQETLIEDILKRNPIEIFGDNAIKTLPNWKRGAIRVACTLVGMLFKTWNRRKTAFCETQKLTYRVFFGSSCKPVSSLKAAVGQ
jgi:hypothetical protein